MTGNEEITGQRLARARELMDGAGIDMLVIGPSSDFRYFTGHAPHLSERLTALIIPRRGRPAIVVPQLEAPLIADLAGGFDLAVWTETESPVARIITMARDANCRLIAVNDQLWSGFLLQMQELLPDADFGRGGAVLTRLRAVKDAAELELLREASRRTDAAWAEFCAGAKLTGQTERQIADQLTALMFAHGMESVDFCIVASGPNGASPHHRSGERLIEPGDPVVIDFGGTYKGYFSDITRTPVAGEPDPDFITVYDVVRTAQQAAFDAIRPGAACQDIDRAARQVISDAGYGEYFIHRAGHGIGLTGHEDPYLVEGNPQPLEAGMVVSDEPGIYVPGRWGVRIEDTVVVTEDGAERYNHAPRGLVTLA